MKPKTRTLIEWLIQLALVLAALAWSVHSLGAS